MTTPGQRPLITGIQASGTDTKLSRPADLKVEGRKIRDVSFVSNESQEFDRLQLHLTTRGEPGYWVSYTDQAYRDGSGEIVACPGRAILTVSIEGIDWINEAITEYEGDPIERVGPSIAGMRWDGSLRGSTQLFIGTHSRLPFRVGFNPQEWFIYIDVAHPIG